MSDINTKNVMFKCDDDGELVVFTKTSYPNACADYELNFMDSYCGGDYRGIAGRLKRAWKAFLAKPVCYTGVVTEDKARIKKFMQDCLNLIDEGVN